MSEVKRSLVASRLSVVDVRSHAARRRVGCLAWAHYERELRHGLAVEAVERGTGAASYAPVPGRGCREPGAGL